MEQFKKYIEPQIVTLILLPEELVASSPTGEDYSDPENYEGF